MAAKFSQSNKKIASELSTTDWNRNIYNFHILVYMYKYSFGEKSLSISRENISTTVYLLRNWQSDICASEVNTNNIMLEINDNMFLYNTNFSLRMSIYTCTPEYGSCRCFYFNRFAFNVILLWEIYSRRTTQRYYKFMVFQYNILSSYNIYNK
jgi:hypothetical protein